MVWEETLTRVGRAVRGEIEIFILISVFSIWYLSNINGFLSYDMGIIAIASYALITERNMYLEAVHPPLAQYINGFGQLIFGETLFGAKFSSVIFAILTIYLTYKIGRKIGNRYTGFFAALLLGMTKLYSKYVVQVTYDIILTFFVVLMFYVALLYMEHYDVEKKRNSFAFILGVLFACISTSKTQGALYGIGIFIFTLIPFKKMFMEMKSTKNQDMEDSKSSIIIRHFRTNSQIKYLLSGLLLTLLIIYSPYLRFDYVGISNELTWRNVPDHPIVAYLPYLPAIFYVLGFICWSVSLRAKNPQFWASSYLHSLFEHGGFTFTIGLVIALIYIIGMSIKNRKAQKILKFLITYCIATFLIISVILPATPRYLLPLLPFFSILIITSTFSYIKMILMNSKYSTLQKYASKLALIGMIVLLLLPTSPVISTLESPKLAENSIYSDAAYYLVNYANSHPDEVIAAVSPHIINYYLIDKPANLLIEDLPYPLAYTGYSEKYSERLYHRINRGDVDILAERKPSSGEFGYPINQQIHEYVTTHAKSKVVLENALEGQIYIYYLH